MVLKQWFSVGPERMLKIVRDITHLPEVPDVKQVEGIKELTVPQSKLVMAHLQERADVL